MNRIILTLISFFIVIFISISGYAKPVYWSGNGHWYDLIRPYVSRQVSWSEAKTLAEQKGGYLATITSQDENDFIYSSFPNSAYSWLGGYQIPNSAEPAGGWAWVTREPWSYSNWSSNEPNNSWSPSLNEDSLFFTVKEGVFRGQWGDQPNSIALWTYIIEYEYEPSLENNPPKVEVGPDQSIATDKQNTTVIMGVTIDPDWDTLTYRWLVNDNVLTNWMNAGPGGEASLSLNSLPILVPGVYHFVLEVTDGVATTKAGMNLTVLDLFTQARYEQMVSLKDEIISALNASIASKDQMIASMFTKAQLDQAVLTERLKYDINGDGIIGLEEIIYYLQIISGARSITNPIQ